MAGVGLVPHPVPTAGPPPHYCQEMGSGLSQHTPGRADPLPVASHLSNPRCWKVLLLIQNPLFCHLRIGPRSAFCSYREFVQFFLRGCKDGYEVTSNVLLVSPTLSRGLCLPWRPAPRTVFPKKLFSLKRVKGPLFLQRHTPNFPHLSPCFWGKLSLGTCLTCLIPALGSGGETPQGKRSPCLKTTRELTLGSP